MRVLAITNDFPLPLDRGGPVRFFGLARALADQHEVHLLALRRSSTTDALAEELSWALGGPVETFDRPEAAGGGVSAAAARWTRALWRGVPPWVSAQHSLPLARRIAELARSADVVVILDDYAGIYAQIAAPFAPVVCDKSNVMGWSAANVECGGLGLRRRIWQALAVRLIRRLEAACLRHTNFVVVTSPEEGERLKSLYGRSADAVVPSAVDLPERSVEPGGRAVGWLGSHEYAPNVEGLLRFAEDAWEPLGRAGMRLLVAGADPPEPVRRLGRLPGVEVLGYVEDLDELTAHLGAAVVPLWRGAGVKVKTLTLMAAGLPVAATPVALEGIDAKSDRHCVSAQDPSGLATALRRLVEDPATGRRIGAEARRLIAGDYSWERVGPRFVDAVERAAMARSYTPAVRAATESQV